MPGPLDVFPQFSPTQSSPVFVNPAANLDVTGGDKKTSPWVWVAAGVAGLVVVTVLVSPAPRARRRRRRS